MKKTFYLFLIAVCAFALQNTKAGAQHIISYSYSDPLDSNCNDPYINVHTDLYATGMTIETYFGDGNHTVSPVLSFSAGGGYINIPHYYGYPGAYTIKHVLIISGVRSDSVHYSSTYNYCSTLSSNFYFDANANCTFDSGDSRISVNATIEVDSNGVPMDTITTSGAFGYQYSWLPSGTIIQFKILSLQPGLTVSCPAPAIITDTITSYVNAYITKSFAVVCSSTTGQDISEYTYTRAGRHAFVAHALLYNDYCNITPATLTMNFSPKYNFHDANPLPTSVSGNTITWDFPSLSATNPEMVYVHLEVPSTWLVAGDTVHTSYVLTPITGDATPSNNSIIVIDTVTSSFDPNEKTVKPEGNILSGTQLEYTVTFENTGNDTAFNIHILDTLSYDLDITTLKVTHNSAPMSTIVQPGTNSVKFDFPGINLLDSSHHGQCDGLVTYTINTLSGLPNGTHIDNRAGIYFDYNEVVMTNTTTNIIGFPSGINNMSNVTKTQLYPNPVNDELTINTGNASYSNITITNITGQLVYTQNCATATNKVNVKALPAGVYILTLRGESGVSMQRFEKM